MERKFNYARSVNHLAIAKMMQAVKNPNMKVTKKMKQAKLIFFAQNIGAKVEVSGIGMVFKMVVNVNFLQSMECNMNDGSEQLLLKSVKHVTPDEHIAIGVKMKAPHSYITYSQNLIADMMHNKNVVLLFSAAIAINAFLKRKRYATNYHCPILNRTITVQEQLELGWIKLVR